MKKILVRAPQWLGDAVVSTVFLERLKKKNPDAALAVLCSSSLRSLFETHPAVQSTLSFDYADSDTVPAVAGRLRAEKFDEAYILPRSIRTALEVWMARIPRRVGFGGDLRRFFFTEAVSYDARLRYAHRTLKMLGEETIPLENLKPHFPSAALTEDEAAIILGVKAADFREPLIGLAPASIAPSRTWPLERFAETARRLLKQKGGTALIFGSPRERPVAEQMQEMIGERVINTAGKLDLPQLGWCLSRLKILIANDSGLMHAASAFRVPTVVIFGASEPSLAVPPWGRVTPIQHREISCVPCLRNHCVKWGHFHNECLSAVTVDEVMTAVI